MVYLGRLPQYDDIGSRWREVRVVGDLLVVGSEAIKHGIQIFDMRKVLDLDPASPTTFTQDDLESHWGLKYNSTDGSEVPFWDYLPVGRTHNVVVNHELKYAFSTHDNESSLTYLLATLWRSALSVVTRLFASVTTCPARVA